LSSEFMGGPCSTNRSCSSGFSAGPATGLPPRPLPRNEKHLVRGSLSLSPPPKVFWIVGGGGTEPFGEVLRGGGPPNWGRRSASVHDAKDYCRKKFFRAFGPWGPPGEHEPEWRVLHRRLLVPPSGGGGGGGGGTMGGGRLVLSGIHFPGGRTATRAPFSCPPPRGSIGGGDPTYGGGWRGGPRWGTIDYRGGRFRS